MSERALDSLAREYGVEAEYRDVSKVRHVVPDGTLRALLRAMGILAEDEESCRRVLEERRKAEWTRMLAPVQVVRESQRPLVIDVRILAEENDSFRWTLELENGDRQSGESDARALSEREAAEVGGRRYRRCALTLPATPGIGYHWLEISASGRPAETERMRLIVAPDSCYLPEAIAGERRVWGFQVQLYALRSRRNWGAGDLSDLKTLVEFCARAGAGVVAVNPLHALYHHNPAHASPYSPSSRLFGNPFYVDAEAIADFAECEAAQLAVRDPAFQEKLNALRAAELVDYPAAAKMKFVVLELLYRHFRERHLGHGTPRAEAFRAFRTRGGAALRGHCLFEALQESLHRADPSVGGWHAWPQSFRNADSGEVRAFAAANAERIEFFEYLQWQFDEQLGAVKTRARKLGLGVGLDLDLAVSVDRAGSESWANQDCYAGLASVGAPPDEWNALGQDWGLPPLVPERLREACYEPFIAVMRENMRHAGALRIDHVMWLTRLFWIPSGAKPAEGAYVSYPFGDLLGILALESVRNRCLVIGEDLGTVPDDFRETLQRQGVLSFRPMFFEKRPDGEFQAPGDYPRNAVATVSTHDLPTLKGFWQGFDLDLRERLALFPSEARRDAELAARAGDRARLLAALEREGLLPRGAKGAPNPAAGYSDDFALAVHRFVARSGSKLFLAQLEDVLGQVEQVNLPGTIDQHPNWRRKLLVDLEDLPSDVRVSGLADAVRDERSPRGAPRVEPAPTGQTRIPLATYRLQLNQDFTFSMATELVAYLHALGISHCYASPYLKARPGSTHGYDIVDHNALNPEIGTQADFDRFIHTLQAHGLGQMLDVVPNHMGVMGSDNAWWLDVLENGQASEYADFFDIEWAPLNPELRDKVLVPVLGDHYGKVLESGELKLSYDADRGEFSLWFHEHRFPIDPGEYPRILGRRPGQLEDSLGAQHPVLGGLRGLVAALERLPGRTETSEERKAQRRRDKELHKERLAQLCAKSPEARRFVEDVLAEINGSPGDPRSFDALHELIVVQAYRLSFWRVASDEINYRRFFDINELAALRMERQEVFDATHRLVLELTASGKVDALRIDHPDGLYDPVRYFEGIQNRVAAARAQPDPDAAAAASSKPIYLVVEKIIAPHEHLPESWPVHGTTGYRFANVVNGLFVDTAAEGRMSDIYADFIGERLDFGELVYHAKKLIVRTSLASELNVLANRLSRIAAIDRLTRDFTVNGLREALAEVVACFPVYRTYIAPGRLSAEDKRFVDWAVSSARKRAFSADAAIFEFVKSVLLAGANEDRDPQYRAAATAFVMRFQQLTGPVMAKGFEDTSLYVYNRLLSLNDVGGDPRRFGFSLSAFHIASQDRAKTWPHTMLATTTHDGKRSEDARARINVLSEMPEAWRAMLRRWSRINRSRKKEVDGTLIPSANDEYALYQALIGSWPIEDLDRQGIETYRLRIEQYVTKLMREAKVHSSWMNPNEEYEAAMLDFVRALLAPQKRNVFLKAFLPFQRRISRFGMLNSLSQTLIKLASPGVPDIYQGTELWDFSLVDPDNRRPVNYARRQAIADEFRRHASDPAGHGETSPAQLLRSIEDGRIKLFLIYKALGLRQERPALFRDGEYLPLTADGSKAPHICAFARRRGAQVAIAVVPRLCVSLLDGVATAPVGPEVWSDTRIVLPPGQAELAYLNVFTGESLTPEPFKDGTCILVSALLSQFPVALVHAGPPDARA